MHLYIYIFQFLDQSIHMVLRYSHYTVISGIITYTVIRCKAFGTKTVLIKSSFRKNRLKKFFRILIGNSRRVLHTRRIVLAGLPICHHISHHCHGGHINLYYQNVKPSPLQKWYQKCYYIFVWVLMETRENPFASGSAKYNRILSEVH